MNTLKSNIIVKISAVLLSFITFFISAFSVFAIYFMVEYKFYFSNKNEITTQVMGNMARREANFIASNIDKNYDLSTNKVTEYYKDYYSDKNVFYTITDGKENIIDSNFENEEYLATGKSEGFIVFDVKQNKDYLSEEELKNETCERAFGVTVYIDKALKKTDIFSFANKLIEWGFKYKNSLIFIAIFNIIFFIIALSYLIISSGHTENGVRCNFFDKIPIEISLIFYFAVLLLSWFILANIYNDLLFVTMFLVVAFIWYFLILGFLITLSTRIKTETLFKSSIIATLLGFGYRFLKNVFKNISFLYKTILAMALFYAISVIFLVSVLGIYVGGYCIKIVIVLWSFLFLLVAIAGVYFALILVRLKKGGEEIAGGNVNFKISDNYMFGDFKRFAHTLNNMGDGIRLAVNEKLKSERFRNELITNVSHDIKTPLTSIINYVNLIKKEKIENQRLNEYIDVLDRQSERLKKLVEDLVEASKASSGSLKVELSPCDAGLLLIQAVAEFEEKLKNKGIKLVVSKPEKSVIINADSRHIWRIFDNLLCNIYKYAMPDTRAYLDLYTENKRAIITFKNISQNQLNISADELMERFVRGDASRNTEGSGLGLSIAKSLAELQGADINIAIDGDLFKVSLIFDII